MPGQNAGSGATLGSASVGRGMADCKLNLHFSRGPKPELFRIGFVDETGAAVSAVRGKSDGAHRGAGSFQWTSAVRALAILAVQTRLHGAMQGGLSGERGSSAAALDFALGKPPRWLLELFAARGQRIGRYFRRSNPELKQAGPVTVRFHDSHLDATAITIEIQGEAVRSDAELHGLLSALNGEVDEASPLGGEAFLKQYLARAVAEETIRSLSRVRFTSSSWCREQLRFLVKDELFKKLTRAPLEVAERLFPPSGSAERFAIKRDALLSRLLPDGLRVLSPSCQPGLISLAIYLRDYADLPLQLDPYYLYGVELVERVMKEGRSKVPTIISTGLGPSSPLLNDPRHGYRPIMLGPALSHRMVSTGKHSRRQRGPISEIHMVSEQTTSAMFSLANFTRGGAVRTQNALQHVEPDEVMQHITQGESLHALLWFPHNRFFPDVTGAQSLISPRDEPYIDFTMIFGNEALTSNPLLLGGVTTAIRHAWLALLDSPTMVTEISNRLLQDAEFYLYLRRSLGMHYLADSRGAPQPRWNLQPESRMDSQLCAPMPR